MELALIGIVALLTAGVTLFSGFGLGTILTPVFALFFPVPLAIAATAVVHLANNIFKFGLMRGSAFSRMIGLPVPAPGSGIETLAACDSRTFLSRSGDLPGRPRPALSIRPSTPAGRSATASTGCRANSAMKA